jgi:hypothetical protein
MGKVLFATPAEAMASFLHEGCANHAERTMSIAAFTLSLWQVTHGPITASVLLVQANDSVIGDPLDAFAGEFIFPGVSRLEEFLNGDDGTRTLACPGDPGAAMDKAFFRLPNWSGARASPAWPMPTARCFTTTAVRFTATDRHTGSGLII